MKDIVKKLYWERVESDIWRSFSLGLPLFIQFFNKKWILQKTRVNNSATLETRCGTGIIREMHFLRIFNPHANLTDKNGSFRDANRKFDKKRSSWKVYRNFRRNIAYRQAHLLNYVFEISLNVFSNIRKKNYQYEEFPFSHFYSLIHPCSVFTLACLETVLRIVNLGFGRSRDFSRRCRIQRRWATIWRRPTSHMEFWRWGWTAK